MTQLGETDLLRMAGGHYLPGHLCREGGTGQFGQRIAQAVGALPRAPAAQRLLQPVGLAGSTVVGTHHPLIARDGYLAGLRQVTINADERVGLADKLPGAGIACLTDSLECRQTGRPTVAGLAVVIGHQLPGSQLAPNHAQQVLAKDVAMTSFDDKGLIGLGWRPGQQLRMLQCLVAITVAEGLPVIRQLPVLLIDLRQHGVVDGLQHGLSGGLLLLLLQPADGWSQRVRRHLGRQPGMRQRRAQQLAIGLLAPGFPLYLLQVRHGRLGQILLLGLLHLFPQFTICLT